MRLESDRGGDAEGRATALVGLLDDLKRRDYGFVTVSPATHARVDARAAGRPARDLRDVFGWSRAFERGTVPDEIVTRMRDAAVLDEAGELWRSRIRVSSLGPDLYAHSAYPTRAPDSVFFGPDTYRFASALTAWLTPERTGRVRRGVDIGTGAGPGGIIVAKAASGAEVALVDINEAALALARVNAAAASAPNAVAVRSDLLDAVAGEFDLIVSNPPYLNDPLERAYRHGGGPLGAALSQRIVEAALDRLAPGGTLLLYTGVAIVGGRDPMHGWARERLAGHDVEWTYREIDPDVFGEELETPAYRGADRIAAVELIATRQG